MPAAVVDSSSLGFFASGRLSVVAPSLAGAAWMPLLAVACEVPLLVGAAASVTAVVTCG